MKAKEKYVSEKECKSRLDQLKIKFENDIKNLKAMDEENLQNAKKVKKEWNLLFYFKSKHSNFKFLKEKFIIGTNLKNHFKLNWK